MLDFANKIRNMINQDCYIDSDESKQRYERKIVAKLKAGASLTPKEINFLKQNNPKLYHDYLKIELWKKLVKDQLKYCKSKEETLRIQSAAIQSIGDHDPIKEMLVSAINYTMKEFKKTERYEKLPLTDEEAKQNKIGIKIKNDKNSDENECNYSQSVQYNISFGKYQEVIVSESSINDNLNLLS